ALLARRAASVRVRHQGVADATQSHESMQGVVDSRYRDIALRGARENDAAQPPMTSCGVQWRLLRDDRRDQLPGLVSLLDAPGTTVALFVAGCRVEIVLIGHLPVTGHRVLGECERAGHDGLFNGGARDDSGAPEVGGRRS